MKFIYSTDIHGDNAKYKRLIDICEKTDTKCIVLGGDLYPNHPDKVKVQPGYIEKDLNDFFTALEEKGIELVCINGNMDFEQFDDLLKSVVSKHPNVHYVDGDMAIIKDVCFIGTGLTLEGPGMYKNRAVKEKDYPMPNLFHNEVIIDKCTRTLTAEEWKTYREDYLEDMAKKLEALPKNNSDLKTIYIMHQPPFGGKLDVCTNGFCAGSRAIKEFLENSNAYMSLHGHIHESYEESGTWITMHNKCVSIQPGQIVNKEPILVYCMIDTDLHHYTRYEVNV